jgi:hypothetical protein
VITNSKKFGVHVTFEFFKQLIDEMSKTNPCISGYFLTLIDFNRNAIPLIMDHSITHLLEILKNNDIKKTVVAIENILETFIKCFGFRQYLGSNASNSKRFQLKICEAQKEDASSRDLCW